MVNTKSSQRVANYAESPEVAPINSSQKRINIEDANWKMSNVDSDQE